MTQYNISFPIRDNTGGRYKDWCNLLEVRRYLEEDLHNIHGVKVMGAGTFLGNGGVFDIDVEMHPAKKKTVQAYLISFAENHEIKGVELH